MESGVVECCSGVNPENAVAHERGMGQSLASTEDFQIGLVVPSLREVFRLSDTVAGREWLAGLKAEHTFVRFSTCVPFGRIKIVLLSRYRR